MDNEPNSTQQPTYPPTAPPTIPGALPERQAPTAWPKVLGVIAIVLGVLGCMGGAWGLIAPRIMSAWMATAPPGVADQVERTAGWTMFGNAVGLVMAALLLAGGIGLVNRRAWSVTTLRVWAVARIVFVVVVTWISSRMMDEMLQGMPATGASPGMVQSFQTVGLAMGLIWGCALPILVLIWLAREKIKAETAGWQ